MINGGAIRGSGTMTISMMILSLISAVILGQWNRDACSELSLGVLKFRSPLGTR